MGTAAVITAIAGLVTALGGLGLFKRHKAKKKACDAPQPSKPAPKP